MASGAARKRKDESHARIVDVAARTIREQGVDGTGVDRVMGEAGLTRGGFYAHFSDRHAMIAEALELAFVETKRNLFELDEQGDAWLARATRRYVSRAHADAVGAGCPLPALAGEMTRAPAVVRDTFARHVADLVDRTALRLGDGKATAASRRRAAAAVASWMGALALARTVDRALGDELLAAVRDELAPASPRPQPPAAKGLASKSARAKSSDAEPASTRARSSSGRPARARASTSRSQA